MNFVQKTDPIVVRKDGIAVTQSISLKRTADYIKILNYIIIFITIH